MKKKSRINQSSVDPAGWLFSVAMILIMFASPLYEGQKHAQSAIERWVLPKHVIASTSDRVGEIGQVQPEPDNALTKMPDESTVVRTLPPLPEKHPASSPEGSSSSVYAKNAERLFHPIIIRAAKRYQVDPALVRAIIMAESGYNPRAISKRGAKGLMQLMPGTAKALGVKDSFNPVHNINAGVRYFKQLLNQFDGDVKLSLAAYNAGSSKVRKYQGVPPFKATQYYIKKVFEYYRYYKKQMAGERV